MTTKAKKDTEQRQVKSLLRDLVELEGLDPGERPDFWVRPRQGLKFALEVTEYHPQSASCPGQPQIAVSSRWWKELEPAIERALAARALLGVVARLAFKKGIIPPGRADHEKIARELVTVAESALASSTSSDDRLLHVAFLPGAYLSSRTWGDLPGYVSLPAERFPLAHTHLASMSVARQSIPYKLPWSCSDAATAWLAPRPADLRKLLDDKAAKSARYTLGGHSLWLLIVCDNPYDLESHIFPTDASDREHLRQCLVSTGFDFAGGPFSEVWLLSAASGAKLRLHEWAG